MLLDILKILFYSYLFSFQALLITKFYWNLNWNNSSITFVLILVRTVAFLKSLSNKNHNKSIRWIPKSPKAPLVLLLWKSSRQVNEVLLKALFFYLLTNYMTVINIDPLHSSIICTDAFYNKMTIQFPNIIDVK